DGGAQAQDGTRESDIALQLAKLMLEENANSSIRLILTRAVDEYQHPVTKSELATKNNADLFVSLHAAADPDRNSSGIEIFVPSWDTLRHYTASYNFGNTIANKLSSIPAKVSIRQRKTGIWVINASTCPAVLIEAGYLTNPSDLQHLKNNAYMRNLARNILSGIESYLDKYGR
ncbi:MAG TPA: N-acetylmuramoyl-L-alanine amidase, partial [Chitinophagaceae bacterium]